MRDIKLIQDSDGIFDIDFVNGDFKLTDGLDTAILMGIFCKKRDNLIKNFQLNGGHFTTIFNQNNYEIGSFLYKYLSQPNSLQNAELIKNAINSGLQFLIDENYCKKIEVEAQRNQSLLTIEVTLFGNNNIQTKFTTFVNTFKN